MGDGETGTGETGAGNMAAGVTGGKRLRGRRLWVTAAAAVTAAVLATGGALLTGGISGRSGTGESGGTGGGTDPVRTYDRHHTRVTAEPGEGFAVKLPENASTGYAWILAKPKPDGRVVEQTGKQRRGKDRERMGAGATLYLDFRAKRPGHSKIRLRYCFLCATPHGDPHRPGHKPVELTYDVSVRK
jgi:predicted secreted protein